MLTSGQQIYSKETPAQVFSCEFWKIFMDACFLEHLWSPKHLEDVFSVKFLLSSRTSWRRLQNVLNMSWRCLEDVSKDGKLLWFKKKLFLIRIKEKVIIIVKRSNNLESWKTTITFLLQFHTEANFLNSTFP